MKEYIYLNVLAEGQAERSFAQDTLGPYFEAFNTIVDSRCVMTSRQKHKKGGLTTYEHARRIISLIPEYEGNKVSVGAVLAGIEGVEKLEPKCSHFSEWISKLRGLL